MFSVHKYPFSVVDSFEIDMPEGASILKAECQGTQPCMWALVDKSAPRKTVRFRIFGTGHPIDRELYWKMTPVDTFQHGPFVWHLFRIDA